MSNSIPLNAARKAPYMFTAASALLNQVMGLLDREAADVENAGQRFLPEVTTTDSAGNAVIDTVKCQGQTWRVRYRASYWNAKSAGASFEVFPGDIVQVVGRCGTVLLVEPITP